jgi:TolB-like protein/predicted Ser/Thr protein kinase/Tfp pilus assembly protein PilF
MIGTTISHYRILESLGQGAMGDVFLSEDLRLHRPVALKIMRQRQDGEERSRLLREARAASALNHPNIAVIYDVEESETPDGRVYLLAMEYVPGRALSEVAAEGALSLDQILDLMEQMADALASAHARGVVHGDLKPSNLMVVQGRIKVLDFGLARMELKLTADAPTWTRDTLATAGFEGTPPYMSPEQALGKQIDAKSDIFSLGVVFYELLAGQRPWKGNSFVELADAILHRDPPPIPPRFSDVRWPEIERLIARMLVKEPPARVQDLREVRSELGRLRYRAPVVGTGTLTVAVAGFANITQRAEDDWLGTGLTETVTTALQEIEGLEVWGRDRLRESLQRLDVETEELGLEDAVELGHMTGARWVLAGGYQRQDEQVRVTARVVETETAKILRAVKLDGSLAAIFDLQDRVVNELASGLRRTVAAASEGDDTQIVAAYEALSKGLLNIRDDSHEALDRAILFFERAVALDPNYVRAQIELGAAWEQKGEYFAALEYLERAENILRRALETRPRIPRIWRELGVSLLAMNRVEEAMDCLKQARALAPDDYRILAGMARAYFIGKADFKTAADLFAQSVERNPEAGWYLMQLAHCYALLRDFSRGEPAARRAIDLQEAFVSGQQGVQLVGAYMRLGHLLSLQGRHAEASDAFVSELAFVERVNHALRSRIRVELSMRWGLALLGVGNKERAESVFASGLETFTERLRLGADEPFSRYYAAAIHALRGEADEALKLLESAAAGRPAFVLARARIEPEWESLRADPRFERLVRS